MDLGFGGRFFFSLGDFLLQQFFALLHTSGRTSIHRTASRSQVRAQGHRGCYNRSLALCFVLVLVAFYNLDPVRGEGSVMGMRDVRAGDEAPAKKHVVEPRKVFEPCQTHFPKNLKRNAVQKRSYRRALHRISTHGYTWYKGKLISGASSTHPASTTSSFPTTANHAPPSSMRKGRLNVFSWNCGSMTQTNWDLFQQWLSMQSFDIVLLQETHWQFSSEWTQ